MTDQEIENLKRRGSIDAFILRIDSEIHLITSWTFEGYKNNGGLKDLHLKLNRIRSSCDLIDRLLKEVNKLDKKST